MADRPAKKAATKRATAKPKASPASGGPETSDARDNQPADSGPPAPVPEEPAQDSDDSDELVGGFAEPDPELEPDLTVVEDTEGGDTDD